MKNIYRVIKGIFGIKGNQSKEADKNVMEFMRKGKLAKMKIEHITEIKRTQTYYIAKGIGAIK